LVKWVSQLFTPSKEKLVCKRAPAGRVTVRPRNTVCDRSWLVASCTQHTHLVVVPYGAHGGTGPGTGPTRPAFRV